MSLLPLSLWSWQESLRAVLSGKAVVVTAYEKKIRSVSLTLQMPSVIALKQYHSPPQRTPAMSRRNVYLRDGYRFSAAYISDDIDTVLNPLCPKVPVLHAALPAHRSFSGSCDPTKPRRQANMDEYSHCM